MRYFLDTEFEYDGKTIMPISLALVAEDPEHDPLDFIYFEFDFDEERARKNQFVRLHVLPVLSNREVRLRVSLEAARMAILAFLEDDPEPEFWADHGDFDWVIFSMLFGKMEAFPRRWPKFCRDLQQLWHDCGRPVEPEYPRGNFQEHHALGDAVAARARYAHLSGIRLQRAMNPVASRNDLLQVAEYLLDRASFQAIESEEWQTDRREFLRRVRAIGEASDEARGETELLPSVPDAVQDQFRGVLSRIREIGASVPEKAWEAVPKDASRNLDRYLYGSGVPFQLSTHTIDGVRYVRARSLVQEASLLEKLANRLPLDVALQERYEIDEIMVAMRQIAGRLRRVAAVEDES